MRDKPARALSKLRVADPARAQHNVGQKWSAPVSAHLVRGAQGEARARRFLRLRGLSIVACNVRYRCGELDIVARDGATWIFVEVRRRRDSAAAAASIDAPKRGRICRAAQCFLLERFGDRWPPCRFDVILLGDDCAQWLRGAFAMEEVK
jgi:putative endonuclease